MPSTELPIGGREGRAPKIPFGYELGPAGLAWWKWAWKTPQATAWDPGSHYAIARRASLEDERAALGDLPDSLIADVLGEAVAADLEDRDELRKLDKALDWMLSALQRRAGGLKPVLAEMRELDKRLGLDPRAVPELRWKFVDPATKDEQPQTSASADAMAQLFVLPG
ncbi:MAG: hypothetical protein PGN13_16145 [Patulibacter minatonensis]